MLMTSGSQAALESATADWKDLLERAGGAQGLRWVGAPPGWPAATQRMVKVLRATSMGAVGGAGHARSAGGAESAAQGAGGGTGRPASGKEAAGTTAKLVALKSHAGEAGRRASAAS
eukprot:5994252-Pleurochrysis_carterae.AAC.1